MGNLLHLACRKGERTMPQMTNVQGIKIRDRIEEMFGKAN
jgi:hypothetical protein